MIWHNLLSMLENTTTDSTVTQQGVLKTANKRRNTMSFLVGTAITIGGLVVSYTKVVYELGVESQRKKTAIEFTQKFNLTTETLDQEELNLEQKSVNLQNVYLAPFPQLLPPEEPDTYKIRRIVDTPAVTKAIGTIRKKKQSRKDSIFPQLWERIEAIFSNLPKENLFIQSAYAQEEQFNWYGHENNYNFYERYVDKYTIYRFYDDGWILEYKVDEAGSSIPNSFKWIRKN